MQRDKRSFLKPWAWDLHCDIGDDEGDLCGACLQKWEDKRCSMCNSGEHFVPKEMMWPNHTDCVFCAEPEEYAEEKNISIKEAERISGNLPGPSEFKPHSRTKKCPNDPAARRRIPQSK